MGSHTAAPLTTVAENPNQSERRHGSRTPALFSLLYSGMDSGQMLMGDGVVTNLSASGIGIRGNRSVQPGMELALFVDLPGMEEPLCVAQSRVSWVAGRRFGVELGALKLEEQNHLRFFLWDRVTPSDHDHDGGI
jgi:PilZ domain